MESGTLGADHVIILVNFLVSRKTRRDNCLLVPHASYALATIIKTAFVRLHITTTAKQPQHGDPGVRRSNPGMGTAWVGVRSTT